MKKITHIKSVILLSVAFALSSCASLTQLTYNDDIYYSKNEEAKQTHTYDVEEANPNSEPSADYLGEKSYYNEDYDDYEYSDRLEKFDDEYEGEYYSEDERNWSVSIGMGYSPYGSSWGMGFNYGYYDPYFYNPWYDPFYSYYSPWYSPWYMPYYSYPYYGCYNSCYYPGYPSNPIYPGYNEVTYGHRDSKSTGGINNGVRDNNDALGGSIRESSARNSGSSTAKSLNTNASIRDNQNEKVRTSVGTQEGYSVPVAQDRQSGNAKVLQTDSRASNTRQATNTRQVSDGTSVRTPSNYSRPSSTTVISTQERAGYTPSYTRPKSSARKYNSSTSTSSTTRTPQHYATSSRSSNQTNYTGSSRSSSSRSSTATKPRSTSPTRSSTTTQQRSSSRSSSYSAPRSSSSRSSSYSPSRSSSSRSSGSSSGTRSSGSSSKSSGSRSSGSSGGHRR